MTNETKALLMQYLLRIAEHYQVNENPALSFKKRNEVLDRLQEVSPAAHKVSSQLIDSFLFEDRILSDLEKKEKQPEQWQKEFLKAEKGKVEAEMSFVDFCKTEKIPVGGVFVEEYPENKL